ncbi:MAG: hypothetical protein PVH91_07010 [Pseudomonadales bacterium]|jgi:hypothetical protein
MPVLRQDDQKTLRHIAYLLTALATLALALVIVALTAGEPHGSDPHRPERAAQGAKDEAQHLPL